MVVLEAPWSPTHMCDDLVKMCKDWSQVYPSFPRYFKMALQTFAACSAAFVGVKYIHE